MCFKDYKAKKPKKNASLFSINPFETRKKKKNNLKITSAMKYVWVQFKTYNTIY